MENEPKNRVDLYMVILLVLAAALIFGVIGFAYGQQVATESAGLTNTTSTVNYSASAVPSATKTTTTTADVTANWKTYTNTDYGFSFKYPGEWKVANNDSNSSAIDASVDVNTANGQSYYLIEISREKFASVDDYIKNQNALINKTIAEGGPGTTLPAGENVTINGINYTKLNNVGNGGGAAGSRDWYLTSKNGYVYKVEVEKTASEGPVFDLDPYITTAGQILSTFQFTK